MLNAARLSLTGLVLAALSACAGTSITQPAYIGTFDPLTLGYIAGKGPLYTEIVGNPFPSSDEEVGRVITSTMVGAHFGPKIEFTTERDATNSSPYRIVILFNPGRGVGPSELCLNSQQPTNPTVGSLRVMAALCASKDRETSLSGSIAAVKDPDNDAFRALIRQITVELLPIRNPNLLGPNDFQT
ncbi:MAG: hypothetical protein ACTSW2_04105 [Alphaproteobacteria bacterium]